VSGRACLIVLVVAWASLRGQSLPVPPRPATPAFTDVTAAAGLSFTHINGASADKYLVETMGSGGVFFDYDADGWPDLFLVDGGSLADPAVDARARHRLFHNERDGTFADVTTASGIRHTGYGMGACAGDVDNDGRIDLYVTAAGGNALYRNLGAGRFQDITRTARVAAGGWSTSCAFLDADRDGDLDLFVTTYLDASKTKNPFCGDPRRRIRVYCHPLNFMRLPSVFYRNDGRGVFTDASDEAGIAGHAGYGLGVAVGDYDDDGWPDVFVANDSVPNFLFRNTGKGGFTEVGLQAGVSVAADGKARAGMGTEFADFNGDGRLDLVVTNHEFETHTLFRNDGHGLFTDVTVETGLGPPTLPFVGFGVAFLDLANSGGLGLAITNGHVIDNTATFRPGSTHAQRLLLFQSADRRRFTEVGRQAGPGFAGEMVGRGLIAADVDNDGDIDLLVTANGGAPRLLRNTGANGHALVIAATGVRSNRSALGARFTIAAGGRTQTREIKSGESYLGQSDLRVHVGLGAAERADRIEIRWPSGTLERIDNVAADQILTVQEGKGIASRQPFGATP